MTQLRMMKPRRLKIPESGSWPGLEGGRLGSLSGLRWRMLMRMVPIGSVLDSRMVLLPSSWLVLQVVAIVVQVDCVAVSLPWALGLVVADCQ